MNEEAWCRGGVGRHRVVDGCHTRGSSSCRGGLMQLGFKLGLLSSTQKDKIQEIKTLELISVSFAKLLVPRKKLTKARVEAVWQSIPLLQKQAYYKAHSNWLSLKTECNDLEMICRILTKYRTKTKHLIFKKKTGKAVECSRKKKQLEQSRSITGQKRSSLVWVWKRHSEKSSLTSKDGEKLTSLGNQSKCLKTTVSNEQLQWIPPSTWSQLAAICETHGFKDASKSHLTACQPISSVASGPIVYRHRHVLKMSQQMPHCILHVKKKSGPVCQ